MPAIKATPIANLSKPLALRDAGDPEAFTEAAERNVQEMHDMASDINAKLIPAINAAVEPLNTLEANLPAVQNAPAHAATASQKATAAASSAAAAASSASTASAKATEAAGSATGANNAKLAAEAAKTTAQAAATTATASRDAAAVSASTAQNSATDARVSRVSAADSAVLASQQADRAESIAEALEDISLGILPLASADTLGGIKIGGGLIVDSASKKASVKYGAGADTAAQGNDGRLIFKGIITPFYGTLGGTGGKHPVVDGVIHSQWHVCDGTDGTPDLRDRCIVGASAGKAAKSTGGAVKHGHSISTTVAGHPATKLTGSISNASAAVSGSISGASTGISASASSSAAGGTVGNTTLTAAQMPAHNHIISHKFFDAPVVAGGSAVLSNSGTPSTTPTNTTGGSQAHNHSFSGASHNHSISLSDKGHAHGFSLAAAAHAHGHTLALPALNHSVTASATEAENLPPYMALHYIMHIGA